MDIVVTGRHCTVSEAVKDQVSERISTVERFRDRVQRVEVEFTVEDTKGSPDSAVTSEITLRSKGPVVRAEASGSDKMVAFEKAMDKLKAQLRKAQDRRKRHRGLRGNNLPLPAPLPETVDDDEVPTRTVAGVEVVGDGPLEVREKVFTAEPITLAQALDEMELVDHAFFLFQDADSGRPSVVYRRHGYNYGVIHLDVTQ